MSSVTQISAGAAFPAASVKGATVADVEEFPALVASGKHVLVFVPGAFTPTCSSQVPEFIARAAEFESKGVASIVVSTVNDAFVVSAWKKSMLKDVETPSPLLKFVADDAGALATALGLTIDLTAILGSKRATRAALIVENGKVSKVFVESNPGEITVTSAASVLAAL